MEQIDLRSLSGGAGVEVRNVTGAAPDADGVLVRIELDAGPWERGCYWAALQKYDATPDKDIWPDGFNRVQPLAIESFRDLKRGGMFLLLKFADADWLALLPIAAAETLSWLESREDALVLPAGTLGTAEFTGDMPLFAWARDADPYAACRNVWSAAIEHDSVAHSTRLREEKAYPEIFRYLGWCSWEEYKAGITEELLVDAVGKIDRSDLPIRYVLVDDGHLVANEKRQLVSFEPNEKFRNGWSPLLDLRRADGVRWMGLWLNFNGYWAGVAGDNEMGDLNEQLMPVDIPVTAGEGRPALAPKQDFLSSVAFFDAMIGAARQAGFDFVKVDNQAKGLRAYLGTPHPVRAAVNNSQALELACARHMDGLLNCMAHSTTCAFNTRISAVTRCSEDYKVGDLPKARRHLHNSYGNIPWIGQTVWGDHDMFHSNDAVSGRMMAVSKALSGGPIYLSDDPGAFDTGHAAPLCYADGELLRPLAPAAPLPESLLLDPFSDPKPYRVIAPLSGGAAAVAAYNLTEPAQPVSGAVTAADYTDAGAMVQPYGGPWGVPHDGLVIYDSYAGVAMRLEEGYAFELPEFADLLLLICAVQYGWAVIGRLDKYLSPEAAELLACGESELLLRMVESGPLGIWCEQGRPTAEGIGFLETGAGFWRADLPVGTRDMVVRITRG